MKVQWPYQRNKNPNDLSLLDESTENAESFSHTNFKQWGFVYLECTNSWYWGSGSNPTEINVNAPSLPLKDSGLGFLIVQYLWHKIDL